MPKVTEKLAQVGLGDLGRFTIGEETNALYFDGIRVLSEPGTPDDSKLAGEIQKMIQSVIGRRLDDLESKLEALRKRLDSVQGTMAGPAKATRYRAVVFGTREAANIKAQIRDLRARVERAGAAKSTDTGSKEQSRQPSTSKK